MKRTVAVLGGGSFGTALGNVLAENGHDVIIYCRRDEQRDDIRLNHRNTRYFPDQKLAKSLDATTDLKAALTGKELILSAIPTQSVRDVLKAARPHIPDDAILISASKGLELGTQALLSDIFEEELPSFSVAFISGPSFAKELVTHHPTAATVASTDADTAATVQDAFANAYFRVYTTDDVVGLEVAGAVKNVMAIASGISDALGFGHNTRAALITRGLAEITRMGMALGAKPTTLMGLSGMGDLVLTCTGDLSRNRRVGLGIGAGKSLQQVLDEMNQVAEGVTSTPAVRGLAQRIGVEMPIVDQVYQVLYEDKSPRQAVTDLMLRPAKQELS